VVKTVTTTLGLTSDEHETEAKKSLAHLKSAVAFGREALRDGNVTVADGHVHRGYLLVGVVAAHGRSIDDGSGRGGALIQRALDLQQDLNRLDEELTKAGGPSPRKQVEGLGQAARLGLLHGPDLLREASNHMDDVINAMGDNNGEERAEKAFLLARETLEKAEDAGIPLSSSLHFLNELEERFVRRYRRHPGSK
jgi:hypothetical protein